MPPDVFQALFRQSWLAVVFRVQYKHDGYVFYDFYHVLIIHPGSGTNHTFFSPQILLF